MNADDPSNPYGPAPGQQAPAQPGQPAQPQGAPPAAPYPGQQAPQHQAPPFTTPAPFTQAEPAGPIRPSYTQQQAQAAQAAQVAQAGYDAAAQPLQDPAVQAMGRLELTTGFFPLAFILYAVTPVLTLNGQAWRQAWGNSVYDLPPGEHHLHVCFPYLFQDQCGPASLMVPIYAGHVSRVKYDAPFFMFSNGTMQVLGTFPLQ